MRPWLMNSDMTARPSERTFTTQPGPDDDFRTRWRTFLVIRKSTNSRANRPRRTGRRSPTERGRARRPRLSRYTGAALAFDELRGEKASRAVGRRPAPPRGLDVAAPGDDGRPRRAPQKSQSPISPFTAVNSLNWGRAGLMTRLRAGQSFFVVLFWLA